MPKISVYVSEQQKQQIESLADQAKLSTSEYLLRKGLQIQIKSDKQKASLASAICQLYVTADSLEDITQRKMIKEIGGKMFGILKD